LDKLEDKLDNKYIKQEKPLIKPLEIKLGNSFKVNKNKSIEKIEQMLKDLILAKEPSTLGIVVVATILDSSKIEITSETDSDNDIKQIEDALQSLDLKRIHKSKVTPTSLTKNWYPRPTPPDIQIEERNFQSQFSVSSDKLYEWNIDGLSEQEILNKLTHMTMVANSYYTNHDMSQIEVVDLLVTGFTGTLQAWWDKHLTEESKNCIKYAVKTDPEGMSIFNEELGLGNSDAINTLFDTIIEHFIGTTSHLTSWIHDQLSN
jgi:hypothetical protein